MDPTSSVDVDNKGTDNLAFDEIEILGSDMGVFVVTVAVPKMMEQEKSVQNDALLELNTAQKEEEIINVKPNTKSFYENMKDVAYRHKFLHSMSLCLSFMTFGFQAGQRGPSFLDIQLITNTNVEKASTFFTAGSVGFLSGSLVSGILHDRFNTMVLLFMSVLCLAITVSVLPLCSPYGWMLVIFWANSFCMGWLDTGGNADLVSLWGEAKGRPYMQALHFSYALGGVISPLITVPFLTSQSIKTSINETHNEIIYAIQVLENTTIFNNSNISWNYDNPASREDPTESRLIYAYIISGIFTFFAAIPFLVMYCHSKSKSGKHTKKKKSESGVKRDLPVKYYIVTIVLLNIMYLGYCAVEDSFAQYLVAFVVMQLKWTKAQGGQLTSVFWASFAVSRFSGIFFIRCLKPVIMLFICILSLIFTLTGFLLCAYFHLAPGVWVFTVLAGFSMSVIFPTGFTWTQENLVKVSGKVASSILIASSCGTMLNPIFMGYLMQELTPMWYCYLLVGESILCFLIFLVLLYISKFVLIKVRRIDANSTNIIIE